MPQPPRLLIVSVILLAVGGCVREPAVDSDLAVYQDGHHPATDAAPATAETPQATWCRPRSAWSTQPVLEARTSPMGGQPVRITVHHSDFPDDTNPDTPSVLRRIEAAHHRGIGRNGQPGACIAYHFLIGPDGTVYEGRPLKYQGAHAGAANNALNIGVCLLGNFEKRAVPVVQSQSLTDVLDRLRATFHIPRDKIYGHLDFNPPGNQHTDCPGVFLYGLVRTYRSSP